MTALTQKKWIGLIVFLISLITYLITLEPTASLWDCSEFLACAYKLEVGHAPGAPVYMLLGRLFAMFAGNNTEYAAVAINALSAVASALTVLLLYHIIYWLSEKACRVKTNNLVLKLTSAIGALAYAFTDSFWFSAVEAEVYATSSLFSALVFWCIIQYDVALKGWSANRWIILIFFLLGFSVGVHLLNLLALPAMALVVYFKHYKSTTKGISLTIALSTVIVAGFVFVIIPGIVKLVAFADLLFVNNFRLPVYSGALTFIAVFSVVLFFVTRYFQKNKKYRLQFATICFGFWLVGYSSFTVLVIRSADNPFVDINNVENVFGLVDYLNREQYPKRPLVYGNNYNSPVTGSQKRYNYKLYNGRYFKDELNPKYEFDANTLSLFPRMASTEPRHVEAYKSWINIKGRKVKVSTANGQQQQILVPTFLDNIRFFIKYQVGHMYLRYFMWNFAGRQNDTQSFGSPQNGNWISGIKFIDKWRIGEWAVHVTDGNNAKSRNTYYFIPLIIGIIGMLYQFKRSKQGFWITIILFIFTGPAILLYLNEVPITPRERDYVHVGSFLVFSIWIGLGILSILELVATKWKKTGAVLITGLVLFFLVPGLLVSQNWDDHNRSGRYTARDYGKNMLSSCEQNAILFTTADNDTYPIWYLQQVEGFRTDIRQILTPFLPVDWYGNQLSQNFNESGSVKLSFANEELLMKDNQYFPVLNRIDTSIDVKELMKFIKSSDKRTKLSAIGGEELNFIPGKQLRIKVNKDNVLKQSAYLQIEKTELPTELIINIDKNYLTRDELLILDILANNDWERPVYAVYPSLFKAIGLEEYMHLEGMVYRLLPYKVTDVKHDKYKLAMQNYEKVKGNFVWGNVNNRNVFLDHTNKVVIRSFRFRQMFIEISDQLAQVGEQDKAKEMLDMCLVLFPDERVPYSFYAPELARQYYRLGYEEIGNKVVNSIRQSANEKLSVWAEYKNKQQNNDLQLQLYIIQTLIQLTENYNPELSKQLIGEFNSLYEQLI